MTQFQKLVLKIRGMHCRSCEILLEQAIRRVPGVAKAEANHQRGFVEISYTAKPEMQKLERVVRETGYSIGVGAKSFWLAREFATYREFGVALLIFGGLYFLLKNLGLTNLDFASAREVTSLPIVFLVGLTAGVSSCMALVGGLILGFATRYAECHADVTPVEKFRPHLFFNLGRIVGYAILGGVLGVLGSVFQFSNFTLGIVTLFAAGVMLYLGFQLTELSPRLSACKVTLPKKVATIFGTHSEKTYAHRSAFIGGALTFFLPCGFTQAMQVLAIATGNFLLGGLIMLTFALGTAPGLLALGGMTALARGTFARVFFKFSGVLVIFFALINFSSGFALTGVELPISPTSSSESSLTPASVDEQGVQILRMEENSSGYSPNRFTVKKGVPVRLVIDAKNIYSCASQLVMPALGIQRNLTLGENVIEFTPPNIKPINFSCSMGMYRGVIEVAE